MNGYQNELSKEIFRLCLQAINLLVDHHFGGDSNRDYFVLF